MNKLQSPTDIIRLPSTAEEQNHMIDTLKEKLKGVQEPGKLDAATKDQGMPASLLNFYLATQVDLSWINLGKAVFIPVQIAEREGGRKSVFCLNQNEEVLAGIYVTCEGIALKFVKRVDGSSLPAQAGDVYCTRITNRDEYPIFEGKEALISFDPDTGIGDFGPLSGTVDSKVLSPAAVTANASNASPAVCYLWNLICF